MNAPLSPFITTPVGRLVRGNPETEQPVIDDKTKQPKLDAGGQPRKQCYFEVAIPKMGETHWNQTEWGRQIWAIGAAASPQVHVAPHFAWKIVDGDSAIPNKNMKVPNQQQGYPGHWILKFTSGYIPTRVRRNAAGVLEQLLQPGVFVLGHYVQVQMKVVGNGSTESPGVYINPQAVCWSAFGPEIYIGPDVEAAGFGAAPLPAGASAAPVGGAMMPAAPAAPGAPAPAPLVPTPPAPAVIVPPPAAAAPSFTMTPAAGAFTREQYLAAGHTDDSLIAAGFMVRNAPAAAPAPLPPATSAPAPAAPAAPTVPAIPVTPNPVTPNPAFAQVPPAPPAAIAPPPPAAAPAGPQLTPAGVQAGGTYQSFISQGWNDAQLRAAGYLV